MIIYVAIFLLISFFAVEYELGSNKLKWPFYALMAFLAIFAGLRAPDVPRDYALYQFAFDYVGQPVGVTGNDFKALYEPGFYWTIVLFKWLFPVFYTLGLMIFFAIIAIFLKAVAILKYSFNPYLVLLVYYSNFFFLHEMTQVRIGVAISIYLFSFQYYLKRQNVQFILGIIAATMFHYSALIFLATFLLRREHFSHFWFALIMIATLPVGLLKIRMFNLFKLVSTFNDRADTYSNNLQFNLGEPANIFNPLFLLNLLITAYLLIIIPRADLIKDKVLGTFLKFNIVGMFLFSFFSPDSLFAFRVSELFTVATIFLFPYLVRYLPFKKFNIWFVVLIAAVYFYSNIFMGTLIKPYHIYNL